MPRIWYKGVNYNMKDIAKQLEDAGYAWAIAVATQAEIDAGSACGQLALVIENEK